MTRHFTSLWFCIKKDHNRPWLLCLICHNSPENERHSTNFQLETLTDQYLHVDIARRVIQKINVKSPTKRSLDLEARSFGNHKGQLLYILEVHIQHLSYCPNYFPKHLLQLNDLLRVNRLTSIFLI